MKVNKRLNWILLLFSTLGWILIAIGELEFFIFSNNASHLFLLVLIPAAFITIFYGFLGIGISIVLMLLTGYFVYKKKVSYVLFAIIIILNLLYIIFGHSELNVILSGYMSV